MNPLNRIHTFENGLVLLYERMDWTEAFAFCAFVPAGSVFDGVGRQGLAALACEMTNRGAGKYDNRSFLEELEYLGVTSSERAGKSGAHFRTTGLRDVWERAVEMTAMQIRSPAFNEDEFDDCKSTQLMEIASSDDVPSAKLLFAAHKQLFPSPWGERLLGSAQSVNALAIADVRDFHRRYYRPNGMVVAVAGRIEYERAKDKIGELFADWNPIPEPVIETREFADSKIHIPSDTAQTHIRLGFRDAPFGDPDYWRAAIGVDLLSGGFASRLFTEVREKRGLCYSVGATQTTVGPYGAVECNCGTTAANAQQSLDVIVAEIDKLSEEPIQEKELERVKIRIKSQYVMQRESAMRRADALIADWLHLKRIRSLEEAIALYDNLTRRNVEEYFAQHPRRKFKLATLGQSPLTLPEDRIG